MDNIYFITIFSLLFLLVLAIVGIKKNYNTINENNYLCKSQTDWLRGLSIVMIMLSHYYPVLGISYVGSFWQLGCIAFLGVALFLFLSGYGAMYSYEKKTNYLKGYLPKRICRLFIPFIIVYVLDVLFMLITQQDLSWVDFAKIPIMSLPGTLNWYLKVQLALYIVFYLLAKHIKKSNTVIIITFLICFIYMAIGLCIGIQNYWYESSYMFPLGMCFAKYKGKIFSFLNAKYFITIILSIVLLFLFYVPYYFYGGAFCEIIAILGMVQFTLCVCVKTTGSFKFTAWLGSISLELYLVHSAILHSVVGWLDYKENIFTFVLFIVVSIIVSWIVNKISNFKMRRKLK